MMRKTLVDQLDEIQFSPAAHDLADQLSRHSATDEKGVVVLVAAALLIAGECPGRSKASASDIARLCGEFGDLVVRMHAELEVSRKPRLVMRIVGGTDMIGGAA